MNEIKKKHNDFKNIQGKPIMLLINEFILGSKYRKIDILTLFLYKLIKVGKVKPNPLLPLSLLLFTSIFNL